MQLEYDSESFSTGLEVLPPSRLELKVFVRSTRHGLEYVETYEEEVMATDIEWSIDTVVLGNPVTQVRQGCIR